MLSTTVKGVNASLKRAQLVTLPKESKDDVEERAAPIFEIEYGLHQYGYSYTHHVNQLLFEYQ